MEQFARAVCAQHTLTFGARVGEGAFKQTFRVADAAGSPLALKICKAPGTPTTRSAREIDAMLRCVHPNVAKLHYASLIDIASEQHFYTVEEYIQGGTLAERLARGLLNRHDLLALGQALIAAVEHIASHDLVHRDLKPDNIMFRDAGMTPVVVDFGLVRDLANTSLTHTWLQQGPGTPYFAAPEQLNNEKDLIDWRADQFALAVVLGIAGVGGHPYSMPGEPRDETIIHVAERRGVTREWVRAAQPLALPVLEKMLAPWPVERYRLPENLVQAWNSQ